MQRSNQSSRPTPKIQSNPQDNTELSTLDIEYTLRLAPPSLCDYLPDQVSQLLFTLIDPTENIAPELYGFLSEQGFRRSGNAFYKPNCSHCSQCISSRVLVVEFKPSRRYRRVLNRNSKVTLTMTASKANAQEYYSLYQRYITARHADGAMYPPSLHTFEQFLIDSPADTQFMEFREPNGKLIAVAVTDKVDDGLSSIYTFFDPDPVYNSRSLGVYCILKQIETSKNLGMSYVYLGFWIPSVKKMSYKTDYLPIELLINSQWHRFEVLPDPATILNLLVTKQIQVLF